LCDENWDAGVGETLNALSDLEYRSYFQERPYGDGLTGITVIFMCRDPHLNFKRRVRLSKKERKLYMDIMLDFPEMKSATPSLRKQIIAKQLQKEVPAIVSKYKIPDFDRERFLTDFATWIAGTKWLD
jgi:hypothetical protein